MRWRLRLPRTASRIRRPLSRVREMFVLVIGAGRVGSSVARKALADGHTVSVLDEDPLSHERLDAGMSTSWEEAGGRFTRSEEHTSELQSLMRISYAVFCLKKKKKK